MVPGDGVQYFREEFALSPSLVLPVFHLAYYFILVFACVAEPPTSAIIYSLIPERSLSCQDYLRILIRVKIKNSHGLWKYSVSVWKAPPSSRGETKKKKRWRKRTSERGRGTAENLSSRPWYVSFLLLLFSQLTDLLPPPLPGFSLLTLSAHFSFLF